MMGIDAGTGRSCIDFGEYLGRLAVVDVDFYAAREFKILMLLTRADFDFTDVSWYLCERDCSNFGFGARGPFRYHGFLSPHEHGACRMLSGLFEPGRVVPRTARAWRITAPDTLIAWLYICDCFKHTGSRSCAQQSLQFECTWWWECEFKLNCAIKNMLPLAKVDHHQARCAGHGDAISSIKKYLCMVLLD